MNIVLPVPSAFSHLKFDLQPTDRVRVRDTFFTLDRHLERAYLLQTDDPRRLRQSFGHKEFYDMLQSGEAAIERLYYSAHKAELRALFGGRKLENFGDENVAQAEYYASLIDLFDSHFGEGTYCGEEPLGVALARLSDEVRGAHEFKKKKSVLIATEN